ncbi:MAG: beta-glucosidase family protein [Eubacteriaceae bacterium]
MTKIRRNMTIEEMTMLTSGKTAWKTESFPKLGIESVTMSDGPHGLRIEIEDGKLGIPSAKPGTCFPPAVLSACSWDVDLIEEMASTIANEAIAGGIDLILGPGINIKRSPLCGRNFEYFSEDPVLSGKLGKAYVLGAKKENVGATIKHFLGNNQETHRMTINEVIDERALREIYLKTFEIAIKESEPMAVMCAYNSINGEFLSQNRYFLTDILRKEWGYQGIVISDWGAVYDRVLGVSAGLDLEMPGNNGVNNKKIFDRVKEGNLKITQLNALVERMIDFSFKAKENRMKNKKKSVIEVRENNKIARKVAVESMVLLKNEGELLPIQQKKYKKIAVIGSMAFDPRFQGSGSSKINPYKIETPFDSIKRLAEEHIEILPHQGYFHHEENEQVNLESEAIKLSKEADLTLLFLGLPETYESEGYDRENLDLPQKQCKLIEKICKVQQNTVVILSNGGVVDMSWESNPKAIVEMFLGGQAGGGAIASLLFGKENFSGKLAETIPMRLEDTPSYINFPGIQDEVIYGESIFVGYRYYDYKKIPVRYPFGFGLSYTKFEYEKVEKALEEINEDNFIEIKIKISNVGKVDGKETVQVYTGKKDTGIIRPIKELKAFRKVDIPKNEHCEVRFKLSIKDFEYFNPTTKKWEVEEGRHEIYVGSSSKELPITYTVFLKTDIKKELSEYSYIEDFQKSPRGKIIIKILIEGMQAITGNQIDPNDHFFVTLLHGSPLRKLIEFSRGLFTEESIQKILELVNGSESLEGITFEDFLVGGEAEKKGFFKGWLSQNKEDGISIHSKIREIVDNPEAMAVMHKYFDEDAFKNDLLEMAIRMGIRLDKAQKLLPDDFFSEDKLKKIEKDFKEIAQKAKK